MSENRRRGLHPAIAFILGILFGIILLIGLVVGAVFVALSYNLDKLDINKDSDGNYVYINADPENGGVKNGLELIKKLQTMAGDVNSLSLGEIEELLPVADKLTDTIQETLSKYIELDMNELKAVKFSALGDFVQNKVRDIRPSALLDAFGAGGLTDNKLIEIALYGKEASYVENQNVKYPVYYDTYVSSSSGFVRSGDSKPLNQSHAQYLVDKGGEYRLYFYNYINGRSAGNYYITQRTDGGSFEFTLADISAAEEYSYDYNYSEDTAVLTGNYYYEDGAKVEVAPITVGTFMDGKAFDSLDEVLVTEFIDRGNDLTDKILGDLTIGSLLNGSVDFEKIVNDFEISTFVDIDPTNSLMVYFGYGIKSVLHTSDGSYRGTYQVNDSTVTCYLDVDNSGSAPKITEAYYYDENGNRVKISGTTVKEMDQRVANITDELALSDVIRINAPTDNDKNAIMIFLAFSVTDVVAAVGNGYDYTGTYVKGIESLDCYLRTSDGEITDVYYIDENGNQMSVDKTSISDVSSQISRLTRTLRLKDVITINESDKVMSKLGDYIIDEVGNAIDELTLDDFIDVTLNYENGSLDTSETVLAYVVYGLTDIKPAAGVIAGQNYSHKGVYNPVKGDKVDCFIQTEYDAETDNDFITRVFYIENGTVKEITGTVVNDVSDRVGGVTSDIRIGQLMNVSGNMILESIKDSTIDSLSDDISNLAVNELYADNVYSADSKIEEPPKAERYLATTVSNMRPAASYKEGYIYYTYDTESGEYLLAGQTGKLTEEEFDKLPKQAYYTCGERNGEKLILFNQSYLYFIKQTSDDGYKYTYVHSDDDENRGQLSDAEFKENTYYTYGATNAMWKLLLYNEGRETAFSVNNLTKIVTNVSANTENSTMRELHEAGIMTFDDPEELDLPIKYNGRDTTVGELQLNELVGFFVTLAKDSNFGMMFG